MGDRIVGQLKYAHEDSDLGGTMRLGAQLCLIRQKVHVHMRFMANT